MNFKRHKIRTHLRRKCCNGYWQPKWARYGKLQKETFSLKDDEKVLDLWLSKTRIRRWKYEDAG